MNRAEFMKRLRELLSDISESEREEALHYYEDYFDDAGEENEDEVIASLGSPEKVAKTIKDSLNEGGGEFSENGESGGRKKKTFSERRQGISTGGLICLLILVIFALPVLWPTLTAILSAIGGVIIGAVALVFAVLIFGLALVAGGAGLFGVAVVTVFSQPAVGVLLLGTSFCMVGIGILLTIFGGWIVWKVVPPMIRGFVKLCRKPFEKKEV